MTDPVARPDPPVPAPRPRKAARTPRADRTLYPQPVRSTPDAHVGLTRTPLVRSRSLGPLLGLRSLQFKLEAGQPTGTWLDRGAARLVKVAVGAGATGLGIVGADRVAISLAAQCARNGLRLVVLEPFAVDCAPGTIVSTPIGRWLSALGARLIAVEASTAQVEDAVRVLASSDAFRVVDRSDASLRAGLADVLFEIDEAGQDEDVVALTALTGHEALWLADTAGRRPTPQPPLLESENAPPSVGPFGLVGYAEGQRTEVEPSPEPHPDPQFDAGDGRRPLSVLARMVSHREVEAARRLLAREEGLLVSAHGAAGLAALSRAVHERLLPRSTSAVVILTGEPSGLDSGPALAADSLPTRPVSLAELQVGLARLLVERPSPPGG